MVSVITFSEAGETGIGAARAVEVVSSTGSEAMAASGIGSGVTVDKITWSGRFAGSSLTSIERVNWAVSVDSRGTAGKITRRRAGALVGFLTSVNREVRPHAGRVMIKMSKE